MFHPRVWVQYVKTLKFNIVYSGYIVVWSWRLIIVMKIECMCILCHRDFYIKG